MRTIKEIEDITRRIIRQELKHSSLMDMPDSGGSNMDHDPRYVKLVGPETIFGEKTFKIFPLTPSEDPDADYEVANKQYVDGHSPQITVDDIAPTDPEEEDIWVDTSRDPSVITLTSSASSTTYPKVCCFLCDASGGAVVVSLDNIANVTFREFFLKKTDTSANLVSFLPKFLDSEFIDGKASISLTGRHETVHIVNDAKQWHILDMDLHLKSPATITLTTGTSSDAASDLQTPGDGNIYAVAEVVGVPGFNLSCNFTGIVRFDQIYIQGAYIGLSIHEVWIQLYNFDSVTYDDIGRYPSTPGENPYSYFIGNSGDYVSSTGQVFVRFYHKTTGDATHDLYLDYVALRCVS